MSSRFVIPRKTTATVPEADRITATARTVTLSCGCKTRKPPAATKAGGIHLHFCPDHPGLQKERR